MPHVALLAEKIVEGGLMTDLDRRLYMAFTNSLVRATRQLGFDPSAAPVPTLADIAAEIVRRRRGKAAA